MGVITDISQESITDKLESRLAVDPTTLWMKTTAIAEYVLNNYYTYFSFIEGMDLAWSDEIATVAIRMQHDILDPIIKDIRSEISEKTSGMLHLEGNFWNFIMETLGAVRNSSNSQYSLISSGFVSRTKSRLSDLERNIRPFTDAELLKLWWVIDNYENFEKLLLDDINYVITAVMGKVEPLIYSQVEIAIAPYDRRLTALEGNLGKTQFWFWDMILDIWAFVAGGSIIPIDQIEDAMITIGEWFIDEIYAITDPLTDKINEAWWAVAELNLNFIPNVQGIVKEEIEKIDSLTQGQIEEVALLIAAVLEIRGGGVGPPGPAGPMGSIGPAGPAGPAGPPGEGNGADVNTINRELYNELWNATAITTSTVTGVIDWMLLTYGERFGDLQGQLTPITEFFTDETKLALTELVDKFGTPEAIISFLIPDSEGQEVEVLDLMQVLISMTFERGQ